MTKKIIHINHLMKKYGQRKVVSDVSMTLNKGEIIGLLGPNGAGKTTTFYMITGMVKVSEGSIMLNETDMEFNNLLNAIQLLRVTLASRPPPENLKKQIYKKVCNKLNSIDFNLNEELLSQWCLE